MPFDHSIRILQSSLERELSSSSSLESVSSSLVAYLGEEGALVFTFFLPSFAMRHVCLGRLGKSDLLDMDLPLMLMVAKSSLFNLKLLSLKFHS
jgi:hypothetical protein